VCAPTVKVLRTVTAAAASAFCGSALGGCHRDGRRVTGLRKCDLSGVLLACWRLKILIRKRGRVSPYLWGSGCWPGLLPGTDRNGPMPHGAFLKPSKMRTKAVCTGRKDARPQIQLSRARMIDLLHNAISLLPESKRNLIRQLFFENESETEVARALGISQPAVNKRKWTILDNLRKRLAPEKIS